MELTLFNKINKLLKIFHDYKSKVNLIAFTLIVIVTVGSFIDANGK